uniref:Uncharacterized protein n=1 Tax=Meloidogyne javanica TaxID=6303 RepID=A0A915MMB9_MELJA
FDQLKQSAQKYEQHNHYTDISYLTFEFKQGEFSTLELMQIDPRTTRTGAHLMAIRKAHAAIICYAAHIPSSFHILTGFSEEFNTSQLAEEKGGKGKGKISKNTARPGEQLATMFGPDCQFKCFSFSALKAEQEAVEAEGLNDNTFIVTILDQLIKRAEDVKSTNVENKKTTLGGMRRLFSRQKSEERNIPVKSRSILSLPNSQQQQPTENGKPNPPPSTSTSIFGNAFRAIITNPRERLKQRNNKIASTVPLTGNDGK